MKKTERRLTERALVSEEMEPEVRLLGGQRPTFRRRNADLKEAEGRLTEPALVSEEREAEADLAAAKVRLIDLKEAEGRLIECRRPSSRRPKGDQQPI